jgi:energy-coupling factor transport system substrate-specific component
MAGTWVRALVGIGAFAIVAAVGLVATGTLDATADLKGSADKTVVVALVAVAVGFAAYLAIEYGQTKRFDSISSQFDTRTIVLIPIAIAINIILGQTVAAALKIPIYLDSIGTILVGVLAGPFAGALTGGLTNLIWTYVLPAPFHSDTAAPFFIVAVEIGLFAGVFGRLGFFRSRPNTAPERLIVGAVVSLLIVGALAVYTYTRYYAKTFTFFSPEGDTSAIFQVVGYLILVGIIATIVGFLVLLFARRDLGVAYIVVGGAITGVVSALISAPIAAVFYSGVTGSGTDLLVAAFQQAGSDLQSAVVQQGLLSDPIDKTVTFFVVFAILGALSRRFVARFPQGEQAVGLAEG